jgi:hypothetical protein
MATEDENSTSSVAGTSGAREREMMTIRRVNILRRHRWLLGWIQIAEGIVEILSLGCWSPQWTLRFRVWALCWVSRGSPVCGTEDEG